MKHPKRSVAAVPSSPPKKPTPEDLRGAAFFASMDTMFDEMMQALPGIQAAAGNDPQKLREGLEQWKQWYLAQRGGSGGQQ